MQQTLEQAIAAVTGEQVRVIGAGRTDAGAHALGQVVAFSSQSTLSMETLQRAINANLPCDVAVVSARDVAVEFHPRFDAVSRVYRYLICDRPVRSPLWLGRAAQSRGRLDVEAMNRAAARLEGRHDFSAFAAAGIEGSRERTMYRAQCWRDSDLVVIELEADGFMRQMVRTIAGTLTQVGRGKLVPADVERILQSRDRTLAADTAPAEGLYLVEVRYPPYVPGSQLKQPASCSVAAGPEENE